MYICLNFRIVMPEQNRKNRTERKEMNFFVSSPCRTSVGWGGLPSLSDPVAGEADSSLASGLEILINITKSFN